MPHAKILQFLIINWWKFLVSVSLRCYNMQYILHLDLTILFMKIGLLPQIIFVWFCFFEHCKLAVSAVILTEVSRTHSEQRLPLSHTPRPHNW